MDLGDFQKDISLAGQINFRLGGRAKYFFIAKTKEEIIEAIKLAKNENLPLYILGGGANILVSDEGFDGLVLKIGNEGYEIEGDKMAVGAGSMLGNVVEAAAENSLSGFEWAAGIPGQIGGAIYGNAQAFGGNMAGLIEEVEAFDSSDFTIRKFNKKECDYSEKTSVFKKNKNLVILAAKLILKKGDKEKIRKEMKEHSDLRREKHPLNYPSAGSMFVNTPGNPPSSYLIEQTGLKGLRVGGAQVSEQHAGFIINLGNATCKDVLDLVEEIKKRVNEKFGIILEQEVQIIKNEKLTPVS